MKSICVFCGSRAGNDPAYRAAAERLGELLVERDVGLVFGGGSVGLMGAIADRVLERGGRVTGVIPHALSHRELLHPGVEDMRVVDDMHARKALMANLADAFVAMPGGYGTFEELFEVITWAQLGLHAKPIGLLNVAGYFDPLVRLVDHAIQEEFVSSEHRDLIVVEERPEPLLDRLATHAMPPVRRWIGPGES